MIPEVRFSRGVISVGLVLLVAAVFGQVAGHDFVNLDDGEYVYANPDVLRGLTPATVAWAFTTGHAANWHPLTWLSHALDVTLFGAWAGGHHLTSVALHAANAVLLFLVLSGMTAAAWRSALVAALFAVHPLHVEAVAWVSERKEVLSTLFGLLALGAYHRYSERPGPARMFVVALLLALSLLSKPMWVTLPFVLLLLDYWPLARRETAGRLVVEKLPLFALSALSSGLTWFVQSRAGAVASGAFPFSERALNTPIGIVAYLQQALWPAGLAVFYPHPGSLHQVVSRVSAALALGAVSLLLLAAFATRRRRPYVCIGLLWYLGTLVPVIGLVQVGLQARADRYTYVPLIGIFVAVAWALGEAIVVPRMRRAVCGTASAIVVALAIVAFRQASLWRDGSVLYRHAITLTAGNWLAWNNLGTTLLDKGEPREALWAFENAVRVIPDYAEAWYNAGVALGQMGEAERALAAYREALRLDPANADAWVNLGVLLTNRGGAREALPAFEQAARIRPDSAFAWYNAGVALAEIGETERAIAAYRESLRLDEGNADAWARLGLLFRAAGRAQDAEACFRRTLALRSRDTGPPAH